MCESVCVCSDCVDVSRDEDTQTQILRKLSRGGAVPDFIGHTGRPEKVVRSV